MTTISPSKPSLTTNDSAVLQALFDAESSPKNSTKNNIIDPTLPALPTSLITPEDHATLQEQEITIIQSLQSNPTIESISDAISSLSALIERYPRYPSGYVNRAQALRILVDSSFSSSGEATKAGEKEEGDDALFTPRNTKLATTLFSDLSTAISLLAPLNPDSDSVSTVQARILADAYTHRGYILLKAARRRGLKDTDTATATGTEEKEGRGGPAALETVSGDQLEEMASRDFFLGGRYGNEIARQLAVQTNPYAKMCGKIVKEAMRKEVEGGEQ